MPAIRRDEDPTRAQVLRIYLTASLVLGPLYATFFILFDAWWMAVGPIAFAVVTGVAWTLRRRECCRPAALLLVLGLWAGPAWCAVMSGGLDSPLVIWMAPSSFIAGPLLGRRASVVTGAASVLFVIVLGILPAGFPGVIEMQGALAHLLLGVMCGTTAIGLLAFYGYSATASYEASRAEMAAHNAELAEYSEMLDEGNVAMKRILDNVAQGFLMLDARGRISGRWSRVVEAWIGAPEPGQSFWDFLRPHDPVQADCFELGFDELESDWMPRELVLDQMPKRLTLGRLELQVDLRDLEGGELLVVITDITDQLARQQAEAAQQDVLSILRHVRRDRTGVRTFLRETSALVDHLGGAGHDLQALKRDIHTVKGNAGLFGLRTVASLCHALEDDIAETGEISEARRVELEESWAAMTHDVCSLIGRDDGGVELDREELDRLVARIEAGASVDELVGTIRRYTWEDLSVPLGRLGAQAGELAERLQLDVEVEVDAHGLRAPGEALARFWGTLPHVLRNALDHGLEPSEARVAAGKPPVGHLSLTAERVGDHLDVVVIDDGRGVDWDRIEARATEQGLPAESHDDLVMALFSDGLTTREEVSALSGRGVGAAAVMAELHRLGGHVEVESAPGEGAAFRFHIPAASVWPSRSALRHAA